MVGVTRISIPFCRRCWCSSPQQPSGRASNMPPMVHPVAPITTINKIIQNHSSDNHRYPSCILKTIIFIHAMVHTPTDLVPLTADEQSSLLFIFKKRRRFLAIVYILMFMVAFVLALSYFGMDTLRNYYVPKDDTKYPPTLWLRIMDLAAVTIILLASGIYFYINHVLTYKRDARSGVKERVAYTITRKEYFPLTDQYFVSFDDPDYSYHETDRDTWYHCNEGGYFFIHRAKRSKFVFR